MSKQAEIEACFDRHGTTTILATLHWSILLLLLYAANKSPFLLPFLPGTARPKRVQADRISLRGAPHTHLDAIWRSEGLSRTPYRSTSTLYNAALHFRKIPAWGVR